MASGVNLGAIFHGKSCVLSMSYIQNMYQRKGDDYYDKELRVPVDHGNRNMKTTHFLFTTGLNRMDRQPARDEEYLEYEGNFYTLSERRIPYQRDKTQDSRFFILTLFAIAKELKRTGQVLPEDVVQITLPIGLPPKHFAELGQRYEAYFKGNGV